MKQSVTSVLSFECNVKIFIWQNIDLFKNLAQQWATIPSPITSQTVNLLHSFDVLNVSLRLMTFFSIPSFFEVKLMGKRREINSGRTHTSPSSGRTSVCWRRAATQGERDRETERRGWVRKMRMGVGVGGSVRMRESAFCMGAERESGPAQGSAPPADKRSILSISLSALDNKQKFNRPSSCLAFEMCGSHMRLHPDPSGKMTGSHLNLKSGPQSLK